MAAGGPNGTSTLALRNGPSRGGYAESAKYFGQEFDLVLKLTVPIVEACEVSLPQFGQWLVKDRIWQRQEHD